jgi:fluoride exporter
MASRGPILGVISVGGALGALARWGLGTALPTAATGFPLATFVTNVSGCLLIGVLMVFVTEVWTSRRLLRPFLGVGVLGGYTTFSTYAVESTRLFVLGAGLTALAYLAATVVTALAAVYAGTITTRWAIRRPGRRRT